MMKNVIAKFLSREVISYLIAGVLTTLINIFLYYLFWRILGIENLVANGFAWLLSVIFAFIINNKFVFLSKKKSVKDEVWKFIKFLGARIVSFGVDEAGMFLFVDVMDYNNMLIKIIMNVVVIIMNYVFSKFYIF